MQTRNKSHWNAKLHALANNEDEMEQTRGSTTTEPPDKLRDVTKVFPSDVGAANASEASRRGLGHELKEEIEIVSTHSHCSGT